MYCISWDYVDESGFVHPHNTVNFDNKDEANKTWGEMKKQSCFANMEARIIDDKYIAVVVEFYNYNKQYTYLAKHKVTSKHVVVATTEGPKVVTVKQCYETTKAELEKLCSFSKFQYILGVVKEDK